MGEACRKTKRDLQQVHGRLLDWLVGAAYPCWAARGVDPVNGGFVEVLAQDGSAPSLPRRARVQPRQIYCFGRAPGFGWRGDAAGIISRGMEFFTTHYQRGDGLFRTLVAEDGATLDEHALLYDQAFALLGYTAAATALEALGQFEGRALALRDAIERRLGNPDRSLLSEESAVNIRESNPYMHLLEACLAWAEVGSDRGWLGWVRELSGLALTRLIRQDNGAIGEYYRPDWRLVPGPTGRIIEPGHQYEWAWLLLRCESMHGAPARTAALRLIDIGEQHGLRNGVVLMTLTDDWNVTDDNARLWSQTERLKAAVLAATLTKEPRYWSIACAAADSMLPYLQTPLPGLWLDVQRADGTLPAAAAPASTFYHVIGAIHALHAAMQDPGE
jgi:mannose/cellobiose epimerase-like protein (N-acyl-D-glucosamine 2-epimerase family)